MQAVFCMPQAWVIVHFPMPFAYRAFASADCFLLTILPLLFLMRSAFFSFVAPPVDLPRKATTFAKLLLTRFAFIAFMAFIAFIAFIAFMAAMISQTRDGRKGS